MTKTVISFVFLSIPLTYLILHYINTHKEKGNILLFIDFELLPYSYSKKSSLSLIKTIISQGIQ